MRSTLYLFATLLVVSPTILQAQYDFDDFLQAVESGKAKSETPSRIAPRLAQRTESPLPGPADGKGAISDVPSITEPREVPPTSILPTPNPDLIANPLNPVAPQRSEVPASQGRVSPLQANQAPMSQPDPMPLSMIEESENESRMIGPSVVESPMVQSQTRADSGNAIAPGHVDFQTLFEQPQLSCNCGSTMTPGSNCSTCSQPYATLASCPVMPYRQPNLPAPSSLRGYFSASPCLAHVWDGYACEAAPACAKFQQQLGQHDCPPAGRIYDCGGNCGGKCGSPNCH